MTKKIHKMPLVSSSIGITKDKIGRYFMQIIVDQEDDGGERNDYYVHITKSNAERISRECNLIIEYSAYSGVQNPENII